MITMVTCRRLAGVGWVVWAARAAIPPALQAHFLRRQPAALESADDRAALLQGQADQVLRLHLPVLHPELHQLLGGGVRLARTH